MKESQIEKAYCNYIKSLNGIAYKFESPGCNGVPDRLILLPIPKKHMDIVSKYIKFVEHKKPGEKPRPNQIRQHNRIKKLNFKVEVVDYEVK